MKTKEYTYKSATGLADIKAWQWYPDDENVKAVIQMHHGMAEHCGRYKNFIKAFTDYGYAVFMNDMINHGKSNNDKNMLGYFGEKDGYRDIIRDARQLTEIAKKEYPDKKLIISGHSMGSMVMRSYINYCPCDYDAAVFIGTSGTNPIAKIGMGIMNAVGVLKGFKHHSPFINKIGFSSYDKPFEHRTSYDWGMRDQAQVDEYMADEYCGFLFTVAGYKDLSRLVIDCNSEQWFKNVKSDMPVLLASGTMDPVGNYSKGVKEVYQRLVDSGHTNVSIKLYDDARHEILNELNKEEVYSDINSWIEKNVL